MDENIFPNEYDEPQASTDARSLLESLTRRYLGDVRIHDGHQAGELARRLGARAFTVGRDIYVRPELVRPITRRSASLLAHELHHVAEQAGSVVGPPDMPLLAPSSPGGSGWPGEKRSEASAGSVGSRATGAGQLAVQRTEAASPSEQGAEKSEAAALNARPASRKAGKTQQPDPEELAEHVYRLMQQEIMLDQERVAGR